MKIIRSLLLLFTAVISLTLSAQSLTTVIPPSYPHSLLTMALQKAGSNYQLQTLSSNMNAQRQYESVASGELDVIWSMTSNDLEQRLLPVRIPIFKGLLGNRLMIIRAADQPRFAQVKTLEDLKQFRAGQNTFWPDAQVIASNQLPLVTSYQYPLLYPMLLGNRFDYLALGAQEIWYELSHHADDQLTVERHLLLQYRAPAYFFVAKDRQDLADTINKGLELMIADGSFEQLMKQEMGLEEVYQRTGLLKRTKLVLENPNLPAQTPINRPELWLDLFN